MNKVKITLLAAGFVLAITFTFSCSSGDEGREDGGSSSSTEGGGQGGGSSSSGGRGDDGSVAYEGQTYRTVKIGTQTWFAENLNYAVAGSKCYGEGGLVYDGEEDDFIKKMLSAAEVQANCVKYGRLYYWSTAMALPSSCNENSCSSQIQSKHRGICPDGWHIPSNDDWDVLMDYVGGYETAGKHLKAQSGWEPSSGIENLDTYGFSALPGNYGVSDGSFYDFGIGIWWSAGEDSNGAPYYRNINYDRDRAHWTSQDESYTLYSVRCLQD
jgi:uncharacterized protein (TIGR02145 family)